MRPGGGAAAFAAAVAALLFAGCAGEDPGNTGCGPASGEVARAIDGDTIELTSGEKIRYLMVDTPESTSDTECYGEQARSFNKSLVEGQQVTLKYDVQCRDRFDRLLAYVFLESEEVNRLLLQRGFACVLHISPNGDAVADEYQELEAIARDEGRGLWGFCSPSPC